MNGWPAPAKPGPGQESVWDFPRPPRLEQFGKEITVELGGETIASTTRGWRVLETSHPPTYYLPQECFPEGALRPASGSILVRMERAGQLFRPGDRHQTCTEGGVDVPAPDSRFRTHRRRSRGDGGRSRPLHRQR